MIKIKAWNASNSRAIAKFHNAEIDYFGHKMFVHDLIRGSLVSAKVQHQLHHADNRQHEYHAE